MDANSFIFSKGNPALQSAYASALGSGKLIWEPYEFLFVHPILWYAVAVVFLAVMVVFLRTTKYSLVILPMIFAFIFAANESSKRVERLTELFSPLQSIPREIFKVQPCNIDEIKMYNRRLEVRFCLSRPSDGKLVEVTEYINSYEVTELLDYFLAENQAVLDGKISFRSYKKSLNQ
jgi:hypothetical protein